VSYCQKYTPTQTAFTAIFPTGIYMTRLKQFTVGTLSSFFSFFYQASKREFCSRCHQKADCTTGICVCTMGYYGNGKQCWPIPIL